MRQILLPALRRTLFPVLLLAAAGPASTAEADYVAQVYPATQYQTFQGWGTSLAWWAKVVGGYPEPARSDYIDKAFDPVKGLGLTVVRYNIGGGEAPQHLAPNQQFLPFRAAVPGFQTAPGQWDWDADANQRWVLRAAIAKGADQLEAFSNSPPYWLTVSGSVTGNRDGADNLKADADDAFAGYLTGVVKHFHDSWGITFRDLEPLNEPTGRWKLGNGQEGCHVDRPHQNALVKATGGALARSGLTTTVAASDESVIDDAVKTFGAYDSTALKLLSKINTHSYGGSQRTELDNCATSAGKDLWLSEYGDDDASGLTMSRRILEDLRQLHATAWVYWQVVDSAGGWGFLKNPQTDETTTAYTINKKYYVMANYSKFIRPGYRFMAIDDPNSLAAYDAHSRTLVIVTTNSSSTPAQVTCNLTRFTRLGTSAAIYRTSATEDLARLPSIPVSIKRVVLPAPARSVTTCVIAGVDYLDTVDAGSTDYYKIVNRESDLVAEGAGKPAADGSAVQVAQDDGSAGQQWRIVGQGGDVYKVVNRQTGLLLEVRTAATENGAPVDLYHDKYDRPEKSNQQWVLSTVADGYYQFANANSGLVLDQPAAGTAGAALVQGTYQGAENEQWRLLKVPR